MKKIIFVLSLIFLAQALFASTVCENAELMNHTYEHKLDSISSYEEQWTKVNIGGYKPVLYTLWNYDLQNISLEIYTDCNAPPICQGQGNRFIEKCIVKSLPKNYFVRVFGSNSTTDYVLDVDEYEYQDITIGGIKRITSYEVYGGGRIQFFIRVYGESDRNHTAAVNSYVKDRKNNTLAFSSKTVFIERNGFSLVKFNLSIPDNIDVGKYDILAEVSEVRNSEQTQTVLARTNTNEQKISKKFEDQFEVLRKLEGDVKIDLVVDIFDLARVGMNYGTDENSENFDASSDLNYDGEVNIFDLAIVGLNYGRRFSCNTSWECSKWGGCINGTQTRICIDNNDCGKDNDKPKETRQCELNVNFRTSDLNYGSGSFIAHSDVCGNELKTYKGSDTTIVYSGICDKPYLHGSGNYRYLMDIPGKFIFENNNKIGRAHV